MTLNSTASVSRLREITVNTRQRLATLKQKLLPSCPVKARLLMAGGMVTPVVAILLATVILVAPNQGQTAEKTLNSRFDITELVAPVFGSNQSTKEASTIEAPQPAPWVELTVESKDTLSSLFERAGLTERQALLFALHSRETKRLSTSLVPGKQVNILVNKQQALEKIRFIQDKLNYLEVSRNETGYDIEQVTLTADVIYSFAEATISYSLFGSAAKAGLDDRLTMKLASIFGWDIDFALDIREGDSFHLVYEELFLNGEHIGNGDIVAAEFVNKGETYQTVRYTDNNGETSYFSPEGESMRKTFLRTPVDFARISSHFNLKRRHPILHTLRAHKGTDYAASRGTPIRATGAGRIHHKGTKGGYGRTIIVQHGQSYRTLYAHMNSYARGLKTGSKVKQGQIIGYVGSSGLATGPHLHYEFHVHGVQRNPVTVKFPTTAGIGKEEKPRFLAQTSKHVLQLASYLGRPTAIHLAQVE